MTTRLREILSVIVILSYSRKCVVMNRAPQGARLLFLSIERFFKIATQKPFDELHFSFSWFASNLFSISILKALISTTFRSDKTVWAELVYVS